MDSEILMDNGPNILDIQPEGDDFGNRMRPFTQLLLAYDAAMSLVTVTEPENRVFVHLTNPSVIFAPDMRAAVENRSQIAKVEEMAPVEG